MQSNKPQFGQWLMDQVHSGLYEGLHFVDNNKFRVPWKHNSRKDCGAEDNKIFRAWAEVSGKIAENPNDKAKWKTNFRCALHSLKQFRLVEDKSKESHDPHKVYQIIHLERNHEDPAVPFPQHVQDQLVEPLFADNPAVFATSEHELLNHMEGLHINPTLPGVEHVPWQDYDFNVPPDVCNHANQQPMDVPDQLPVQVQQPMPQVNAPSIHDLEITIHYRRREMQKLTVSSQRVQLHYLCEDPTLCARSVAFPGVESLPDRRQADYTQRLLSSIQRGLLLEVNGSGVYAVRQDKCHVFASDCDPAHILNPQPNKLPQNKCVQLLSFDKYVRDLKDFQEHKRGSPYYTITLCFGEKFPDDRPIERKLITVKVVPLACRYFHERAQAEGASSLHDTISLQTSYNSLYDLINSLSSS